MTEEEIKINAEIYTTEYYFETPEQFYIAGAKSRDKEITKLNEELTEIRTQFWGSKHTCNNCGHCDCENYQTQRKSLPCDLWISHKDILAQAREIIAIGLMVCDTSSIEYMNLYQKRAEQFLEALKE